MGSDIPRRRWRYLRVKAPFITSALSRMSIKYGVQVIFGGSREGAQKILLALCKEVAATYGVK